MDSNEKYLRKNIGRKIKLARSRTNYTQEELAEKLSLSTRYISQLERGIAFGSATTIINLCKALNISSLEAYLKLNNYNKEVVYLLTTQLVKMQEEKSGNYKDA